MSSLYNQSAMKSCVPAAARRFLAPTDSGPHHSTLTVADDSASGIADKERQTMANKQAGGGFVLAHQEW
ncbi:hypothetical protein ABZX51_006790 [Aspergillus tubingensis]